MILTAENVENVFKECLFIDGEDTSSKLVAEGIKTNVGFHPERLERHREDIANMLSELPKEFQQDGGGGMSFLNACMNADGEQWTGIHSTMEKLFLLGLALGKVKNLMPRAIWCALPGGMPYYVVV